MLSVHYPAYIFLHFKKRKAGDLLFLMIYRTTKTAIYPILLSVASTTCKRMECGTIIGQTNFAHVFPLRLNVLGMMSYTIFCNHRRSYRDRACPDLLCLPA